MSDPFLLIGCGGHARSLIDVVESSSRWHVLGLVGLPEQVGEEVLGYPVLGCDEDLPLPPRTVISAGKRVMGWPIREYQLK